MKSQSIEGLNKEIEKGSISLEDKIDALNDIMLKIISERIVKSRISKYKLSSFVKSNNIYDKLYAINVIVNEGNGIKNVPDSSNVNGVIEDTNKSITELLSRRYVRNRIEREVEKNLIEKQSKLWMKLGWAL